MAPADRYQLLRNQVDSDLRNWQARLTLGEVCLQMGRRDEGIHYLASVLQIQPGHPAAVTKLKELCTPLEFQKLEGVQPRVPQRKKSFWEQSWITLKYPMGGEGLSIIFVGTLFLHLPIPFVNIATSLLVTVLIPARLLATIRHTATGSDDPPGWNDYGDVSEGVIGSCLGMMGILMLPMVPAYFWPAGIWLIYGLALFYIPMSFMLFAVTNRWMNAMNPALIFSSISRIWRPYLTAILFFYAVALAGYFLMSVFTGHLAFIGTALFLYWTLVCMRIVGLLYRDHQEQLGWFPSNG